MSSCMKTLKTNNLDKSRSYIYLAQTNCTTIDAEDSDREQASHVRTRGKKRIGRYSFYLHNLIGSGYSSKVYKGIKDSIKNIWYAIKVIPLKQITPTNLLLLHNEIHVIQQLQHPNLVQFIDVHYTSNHCYLITQYCEGGNLEKYIANHQSLEWGTILASIITASQYLAQNKIVHRDLKPANIFSKNGKWKIGDFGFAKKITHSNQIIQEPYKLGTPLFMPLQTLQRNVYSFKSDSFALGVIMYYLIFKSYPWSGRSFASLAQNYKNNQIAFNPSVIVPEAVKNTIEQLCCRDMKHRMSVLDCDISIFLGQKSLRQIQQNLICLKNRTTDQVVLCQFINYLMRNSIYFLQQDHILYSLISYNLCHLTDFFKWEQNRSLKLIKNDYILPEDNIKITDQNYTQLSKALLATIKNLKLKNNSQISQVGLQKILEYYELIELILKGESDRLMQTLKKLVLHKDFVNLIPNYNIINQLLARHAIID